MSARSPTAVALLLAASSASAYDFARITALGWTKDGRYFVSREAHYTVSASSVTSTDGTIVDVHEVKGGAHTRYLFSCTVDDSPAPCSDTRARFPGLRPREAYEGWVKANPLAPLEEGKSETQVTLREDVLPLRPDGLELQIEDRRVATWRIPAVEQAYREVWAPEAELQVGGQAFLAPDGSRAAWVRTVSWPYFGKGCGPGCDVVVASVEVVTLGLRIQIVSHESLPTAARDATSHALDRAGFKISAIGPAQKARDKSVIYAARGREPDAVAVAKLVPGGAAIEPLTWEAGFDLVVALGDSARARPR